MKRTLFAATLALLLWGSPTLAGPPPDFDSDGVMDSADNCSDDVNSDQDDTDGDACGNLCDADYDGNGSVGFSDFGQFVAAFGKTAGTGPANTEARCHNEPIPGCMVTFGEFGFFLANWTGIPGPSGTTVGTTACP